MKLSLPAKISLSNLFFMLVLVGVLVTIGGSALYERDKSNTVVRAQLAAKDLSTRAEQLIGFELGFEDFSGFDEQCEEVLKNDPLLTGSALVDSKGRLLFQSTRGVSPRAIAEIVARSRDEPPAKIETEGSWFAVQPVGSAVHKNLGIVIVEVNSAAFASVVTTPLILLVLMSLFVAIISLALEQLMLRQLLSKPLTDLATKADKIAAAEVPSVEYFQERVTDRDMGLIYGAIVKLVARLRETKAELMEQNAQLEHAVRRRTQELEIVNRRLARDIEKRKQLEEELRTYSGTDPLTRLLNVAALEQRLSEIVDFAGKQRWSAGVCLLEIDHLSMIKQTFGVENGNKVIAEAARRIVYASGPGYCLARREAGQFAVILPAMRSRFEAAYFFERLVRVTLEPMILDGKRLRIAFSCGVSVSPTDGMDSKGLLRNAEAALYRAQQMGRDSMSYFAPDDHEKASRILDQASILRKAIAERSLQLRWLPVVNLASGEIVRARAVLKCQGLDDLDGDGIDALAHDFELGDKLRDVLREEVEHAYSGIARIGNFDGIQIRTRALDLFRNLSAEFKMIAELAQDNFSAKVDEAGRTAKSFGPSGPRIVYSIDLESPVLSPMQLSSAGLAGVSTCFRSGESGESASREATSWIARLARSGNLPLTAEAVMTATELPVLRDLGFDFAWGPAVSPALDVESFVRFAARK